MGWRDVERDFYAGKISYAPEKKSAVDEGFGTLIRSIGAGMEGRFKQEQMMRLEEEADRKKKREEALAEQKAEEKKNSQRLKAAKSIVDGLGLDSNNLNFTNHVYSQLEVENDDVSGVRTLYQDLIKDGRLGKLAAASVYKNRGPKPPEIEAQMDEAFKESMSDLKGPREPKGVRRSLANTESRGSGDLTAKNVNPDGKMFAGRYQFGDARLADYNAVAGTNYTAKDMLNMPEAEQEKIADWHFSDISQYIKSEGLDKFIGTEINGVTLTESSLVAVAHLGGKSGLKQFLITDGKYNEKDSNGTSLTDYARTHAMAGGIEETSTAGDRTQETFIIEPPRPDGIDKDDPTSFEGLVVASLLKSPEYRTALPEKQAEMVAAAKASLSTSSKVTKLDAGTVRALYADAQLKIASGDPTLIAEGEAYMTLTYPKHREALMTSFKETSEGDEAVAFINGVMVPGTVGADQSFMPMGSSESIMPQTEDNPNGYTGLSSVDIEKMGAQAVSRASAELDAGFDGVTNAIDVTQQGYELEKLARQHPQVLTAIGGTAVSSFVSAKREVGALLDVIGLGAEGETRSSVEAKVQDYLNSANYQGTESEAQVYKEFSSAMIRYIFAAGKALGQQGNGFSNADYNNIRNSMLSGNGIEDFASGMQRFSRERTEAANNLAIGTRNRTSIQELGRYGRDVGNDLMTVEERLSDLSVQSNRDLPDYIGWMNGNVSFPSADANIETLGRSRADVAKWDAAPSGTKFNVLQSDGTTYVTKTKP